MKYFKFRSHSRWRVEGGGLVPSGCLVPSRSVFPKYARESNLRETFEINEFDNYFEIKFSNNILENFFERDSLLSFFRNFAITAILINDNNIIINKPHLIQASDFNAYIYNIREDTMVITGYTIFYYVLIAFCFINILIYLYIYLRQKKYI